MIEHVTEDCQCEGKICAQCKGLRCIGCFPSRKRQGLWHLCKICQTENARLPRSKRSIKERFLDRLDIQPDGCWLWTGRISNEGYGTLSVNSTPVSAHRLSYEFYRGPIPEGLVIDHLCCVKRCVNPDHLEAITSAENVAKAMHRLKGLPGWMVLYRDLYRQVYGEQVSEEEWREDAEQRRFRLSESVKGIGEHLTMSRRRYIKY